MHDWSPPFNKRVVTDEFEVVPGEEFSKMDFNGESVFRLVKLDHGKALIEYSHLFTLKGYENPRDKKVWIDVGHSKSFAFLWGNKGTTKRLLLKSIEGSSDEPKASNNS